MAVVYRPQCAIHQPSKSITHLPHTMNHNHHHIVNIKPTAVVTPASTSTTASTTVPSTSSTPSLEDNEQQYHYQSPQNE